MNPNQVALVCAFLVTFTACKSPQVETMEAMTSGESTYQKEAHLKNIRQLTFGGDNAEAYWAFGGNALVYQTTQPQAGIPCDQIFVMPLDSMGTPDADMRPHRASTGLGRTTCPYFLPGDSVVVYATTEGSDSACPEVPERGPEGRYVWPIYPTYDMVLHNLHTQAKTSIATSPHYDAEATVSPKGDRMVFTSTRNGDLDLYTCDLDGNDIQQVTNTLGYDGGAFFSPDGKWLVWRASRPKTEEEIQKYKALLSQNLVEPTSMELFVAKVDGSEMRQITHLGGANWAPFFHPNGDKVLFSSNHESGRFPFNIYMINLDGTELEQITFDEAFDSFPMFSPDGTRLAFSSNRNNGRTRSTNVFVADWVE